MKEVLNEELVDQLREVMEDDFGLLLETFLVESQKQLAAVEISHTSQDTEQLSKDAHRLKGSCGNIGALELAQTCATIEADPSQDMTVLITELQSQFKLVRSAVQELQQSL